MKIVIQIECSDEQEAADVLERLRERRPEADDDLYYPIDMVDRDWLVGRKLALGLTDQEISQRVGVSLSTVNNLLNGKDVSLKTKRMFAATLP